jgi:hypothetical protein
MEYEIVTQRDLFDNTVLVTLVTGRKYDLIPQNGDFSRESRVDTLVSRNKVRYRNATSLQKDPPPDNAIRRWLQLPRETIEFCSAEQREDRACAGRC